MQSIVHSRQSLLDISIQECGSIETVFAIAERNGISITEDLIVGQAIMFSSEEIVKKKVVATLATFGIKPATAVTTNILPEGVEYWRIEFDFIVS